VNDESDSDTDGNQVAIKRISTKSNISFKLDLVFIRYKQKMYQPQLADTSPYDILLQK
jgi:hypothetical protein